MDPTDALWLLDDDDEMVDEPLDMMKFLPGVRSGLARRLDGESLGFCELRERSDRPFDVPGGRARRGSRSRTRRSLRRRPSQET